MGRAKEGFQQGNSYGVPYRYSEDTWAEPSWLILIWAGRPAPGRNSPSNKRLFLCFIS